MLGTALNLSRAATAAARATGMGLLSRTPSLLSPSSSRFFCGPQGSNATPVALQMIDYALSHARSLKSDESYAQGLLVLEQCLSTHSNEVDDTTSQNSRGMVLLAMSTLLSESLVHNKPNLSFQGSFDDAIDKLQIIQGLAESHLGVRVASMEGLVGLNLQLERDDTSRVLADKCVQLLGNDTADIGNGFGSKVLNVRAKALKGLVELVHGNLESAESFFQGLQDEKGCTGEVPLIAQISANKEFADPYALAACSMSGREVQLAATCALGQLEGQLGNFSEAEEILTRVLTKTEEHFGSHHPNVGIVLTCIALMFRHKAIMEHSSSLLIQEGLYRRALDLLKAPSLETEGSKADVAQRDIVALARGAYAEVLCVQQNRKDEGERMKSWAQTAWRNRRLSLAEALEISELCSKVPIIDARISRAL
ncbi:hypothetical protein CK203_074891 [Vitis vinifera]|uniref:Uncharacterized protein n=1 Tax=Vitis vinifera TaxID=29760 RepID=A0A438DE46_VITVI|nr:hypothetical protein CK203_074891 [Vitis vinifera]